MGPWLGAILELVRVWSEANSPAVEQGVGQTWMIPAPAEADVHDDHDVGPPAPITDCEDRLRAAGIEYRPARLEVHRRGAILCGADKVVRYGRGPGRIRWSGSPKVTCDVALGMAAMERIVQEEAERAFARPVSRIEHLGTYNCREMAAYPGWVSEHSYANAIDIATFELRGGTQISVLRDWGDRGPKAEFLRRVAQRLYAEDVFSVVLTPEFDRAHRNHLHLDRARYRVDGG